MQRRDFLRAAGAALAGEFLGLRGRPAPAGRPPADTVLSPADAVRIDERLWFGRARGWPGQPCGAIAGAYGLSFLGLPYLPDSLDDTGAERLIVNLHGFDCVTLVETCLALARTVRAGGWDASDYARELERIRYRGGRRDGYPSRLHYFEDWLEDNAARGNLRLLAVPPDGEPLIKTIDYMTTHREQYPVLAHDDAAYAALQATEAELNGRARFYIPKERAAGAAPNLQTGDVLAFTTTTPGLLIGHTGLAYRRPDGAMHVLHAPNVGYPVMLSAQPLDAYLAAVPHLTGFMAGRPQ
jgi:hypothetical protein